MTKQQRPDQNGRSAVAGDHIVAVTPDEAMRTMLAHPCLAEAPMTQRISVIECKCDRAQLIFCEQCLKLIAVLVELDKPLCWHAQLAAGLGGTLTMPRESTYACRN